MQAFRMGSGHSSVVFADVDQRWCLHVVETIGRWRFAICLGVLPGLLRSHEIDDMARGILEPPLQELIENTCSAARCLEALVHSHDGVRQKAAVAPAHDSQL